MRRCACSTSRRRKASVRSIESAICGRFQHEGPEVVGVDLQDVHRFDGPDRGHPPAGGNERHLAEDAPSSEPVESVSEGGLGLTAEEHVHRVGLVVGAEDRLARREEDLVRNLEQCLDVVAIGPGEQVDHASAPAFHLVPRPQVFFPALVLGPDEDVRRRLGGGRHPKVDIRGGVSRRWPNTSIAPIGEDRPYRTNPMTGARPTACVRLARLTCQGS
jgi:hypothetical protein